MIRLIQYPGLTTKTTLSPPCAKVHMTLRAKGLDYEIKNLSLPSQAKKYNPRGRVPILEIEGNRVVDSTDIVTDLDRRYPTPALEPESTYDRARVRLLEDWADEVIYFYGIWLRWVPDEAFEAIQRVVLSRLPIPARWLAPRVAKREVRRRLSGQGLGTKDADTIRREFQEILDRVSALLEDRPFLVAGRLTRADIAVAACLDQYRIEALTPELRRQIDGVPGFAPGSIGSTKSAATPRSRTEPNRRRLAWRPVQDRSETPHPHMVADPPSR